MATIFTKRAIIIIRADTVAAANLKSKTFVDFVGGQFSFTVPLAQTIAPSVIAAYIAGWTMTDAQSTELINRLKEIEATLSNKVRIFDVSGMTLEEERSFVDLKLSNLGLQRMS